MNKLMIIGNLTADPQLRVTQSGMNVCSFTVAVNRRKTQNNQNPEADFFRVSAWNQLAENCSKFLAKGRKVAVNGSVSVHTFQGNDGKTYASMEVMANEVEFLTPRDKAAEMTQMVDDVMNGKEPARDPQTGYEQVDMGDDLPF